MSKTRIAFFDYLERVPLPPDALRALKLLGREAGENDSAFTWACQEFLSLWQAIPPTPEQLLAEVNGFRDSPDAMADIEWVRETTDWELEKVPIEKNGTVYGYVRESYWDTLDPTLKNAFLRWFNDYELSEDDTWHLKNALLTGRIRTASGFACGLHGVLFCTEQEGFDYDGLWL